MHTEKRKKESNKRKAFAKKVYWDLLDACSENINDLVKCAELLLNNEMYSKSFLMSYLALEELGKRLAVCDYITDILSNDEFKKIFRDHDLKIAYLHNQCNLTNKKDGSIGEVPPKSWTKNLIKLLVNEFCTVQDSFLLVYEIFFRCCSSKYIRVVVQ